MHRRENKRSKTTNENEKAKYSSATTSTGSSGKHCTSVRRNSEKPKIKKKQRDDPDNKESEVPKRPARPKTAGVRRSSPVAEPLNQKKAKKKRHHSEKLATSTISPAWRRTLTGKGQIDSRHSKQQTHEYLSVPELLATYRHIARFRHTLIPPVLGTRISNLCTRSQSESPDKPKLVIKHTKKSAQMKRNLQRTRENHPEQSSISNKKTNQHSTAQWTSNQRRSVTKTTKSTTPSVTIQCNKKSRKVHGKKMAEVSDERNRSGHAKPKVSGTRSQQTPQKNKTKDNKEACPKKHPPLPRKQKTSSRVENSPRTHTAKPLTTTAKQKEPVVDKKRSLQQVERKIVTTKDKKYDGSKKGSNNQVSKTNKPREADTLDHSARNMAKPSTIKELGMDKNKTHQLAARQTDTLRNCYVKSGKPGFGLDSITKGPMQLFPGTVKDHKARDYSPTVEVIKASIAICQNTKCTAFRSKGSANKTENSGIAKYGLNRSPRNSKGARLDLPVTRPKTSRCKNSGSAKVVRRNVAYRVPRPSPATSDSTSFSHSVTPNSNRSFGNACDSSYATDDFEPSSSEYLSDSTSEYQASTSSCAHRTSPCSYDSEQTSSSDGPETSSDEVKAFRLRREDDISGTFSRQDGNSIVHRAPPGNKRTPETTKPKPRKIKR